MLQVKALVNRIPGAYSILPSFLIESVKGRAIGPDLSHWKERYDPEGAPSKADFAITKATEGITRIDPALSSIWTGIKKLDIRGLFHYQRSQYSWEQQAKFFLAETDQYNYNILALDVEAINNDLNDRFFQDSYRILQFLKDNKKNSDIRIMLYTNPNLFQNYLYPIWLKYFGKVGEIEAMTIPLWIAQYWLVRSPDKDPGMPKQRSTWDIYQWTDYADPLEWGAGSKELDLNVFNGDANTMAKWVNVSTSNSQEPPVEPPPIEVNAPTQPETEEELWKATVISKNVHIRTYPKVDSETSTGVYAIIKQTFTGKLWSGNGYVWIKVIDPPGFWTDKWVAVRSLDGLTKLLKLEKINATPPVTSEFGFFRVKHDIELGRIWRSGLPEVHPLFVSSSDKSGTHFSPFQKWAQLIALGINSPYMTPEMWEAFYDNSYWIANGHGTRDKKNPRADFVNNKNINKELIRVESLTTGGSFVEGIKIGNGEWTEIQGLHYGDPITLDYLKSHPEYWTRGTYAGGTGTPYRLLGHKFDGPALIHPLIVNTQYGLFIQSYKLQPWYESKPPDPLKIYL